MIGTNAQVSGLGVRHFRTHERVGGGMGRLDGRHAVVTASGGKMGAAIALRLAAEGCDVALNDLDGRLTAAYAEQVRALGRDAIEVAGDVSQRADAEALIGAAIDRWGGVDILVNNVGGSTGPYVQDILAITDEDWDATMLLNTRATFICSQLVVPGMIERGGGKIVNISSSSWAGNVAPYAIAKAAVVSFTRGLARELAPHNINVNAVAPGATKTRFQPPDEMIDLVPLGRFNEPDDIAATVAFLVSEDARNVSGQLVTVAGGNNPAM
jgi:NAD(P)-dependent dehydrogenase (short-subunit alcohol dehydrogenase family)